MDNQLETTDRQSKRRGFFDRPVGGWCPKKASTCKCWP